jgi:MFS family permease
MAGMESAQEWSAFMSFSVIGIGGIGCVVAGIYADKYGRATITIISMAVSGACCIIIGPFFGGAPLLVSVICLVWGAAVVADSAQFSAKNTELADPVYVGTALTLQTCIGFVLTLVSIRLVPVLSGAVSWRWAFAFLALGPLFGIVSMHRLRRLTAARIISGEGR